MFLKGGDITKKQRKVKRRCPNRRTEEAIRGEIGKWYV